MWQPHKDSHHRVTHMDTVKVHVGELRKGMYICELDRPWLETPFLLQGFELKTEEDIRAVQDICDYVYIDVPRTRIVNYGEWSTRPRPGGLSSSHQPPKKQSSFEKEIETAKSVQQNTSRLLKTFMDEVRFGQSVDVQLAKSAVSDCVASILRNPDALMLLTQIRKRDEYTSEHSLNVCIYSIVLGHQLELSTRDLEHVGLCGLLHDLGKIRVPLAVLNKEGALGEEEFALMKQHTVFGRDILMSGRSVFGGTVDVAYGHHENLDGTGYPRNLQGHQMNLFTKMVSVVDRYDAITSHRVYQRGRTHLEAINVLHRLSGEKLDPRLTSAFVAHLGLYPPGSVVELSSGEIAIVIEPNPLRRLRPRLMVLLDAHKTPLKSARFLDLAEREFDDDGKPYSIRTMHRPEIFNIDLQKFRTLIHSRAVL
jgi:HD-GYP domain-containing protein (c-di-GMP phosphodiesterase class II)